MLFKAWKHVVTFLSAVVFVPWLPVIILLDAVNGNLKCESGYSSDQHMESAIGLCWLWDVGGTDYECCMFCDEQQAIASQFILPYGHNPFDGRQFTDSACCCHQYGQIVEGGDGTIYYFK